jgi:cyanophycinase
MPIFLAGGSEFTQCMSDPDLRLIQLAGGFDAPIRIIPAAAAPDNNHTRAGNNGVRWFKSLGATDVESVFVIDHSSASDASLAGLLREARLVYLLGGFPQHLGETLRDSKAWDAVLQAYEDGAVIAGSSAGAMVLCEHYYDPYVHSLLKGLDLISHMLLIPHHNSFAARWAEDLRPRLPDTIFLGVDECTGMLRTEPAPTAPWTVHGTGGVTLYPAGTAVSSAGTLTRGRTFSL